MNETQEHVLSSMIVIPVKHIFTDVELLQKSSDIARLITEKESEEAGKKNSAAEYKNKIDKLQADIKLISGHINNKYAHFDKPCELIANFETKRRQYRLKETGEVVKEEDLHASDYNTLQTKLDLEETMLQEDIARQQQIEDNNQAGDYADGLRIGEDGNLTNLPPRDTTFDPIDAIIVDKKIKGAKKLKPEPKSLLPDDYGKGFDMDDELPE